MLIFQDRMWFLSLGESGILIAALITVRSPRVLTLLTIQLANCMCSRAAKCMDFICMSVNKERKMEDAFKGRSSFCAK